MVAIKSSSCEQRKLLERIACAIARKTNQIPSLTGGKKTGRFRRLWSGGELFHCAKTLSEIQSSFFIFPSSLQQNPAFAIQHLSKADK